MARLAIYCIFGYHAARGAGRKLRRRLTGAPPVPVADGEATTTPADPARVATDDDRVEAPEVDRWGVAAQLQVEAKSYGWLDHGWIVRNYVWPQIFGHEPPADTWGLNAVEAFDIERGGRWLSLGCGGGDLEMQMAQQDLFDTMVAFDASPGAIEVARQQAVERGVDEKVVFNVADLNTINLPKRSYDVIHMNMALHHIGALERLVDQINRALRPGGVFLVNEFIGPNQFQYPDERLDMVRRRLAMLPEPLRWDPVGRVHKTRYPVFRREHWNHWDPTESIRSDEIPGVLERCFPGLRRFDYGGSILNLVLDNIVQNFEIANPDSLARLKDLMAFEQEMLHAGTLPSDFAYFVCPRGGLRARLGGWLAARLDFRAHVTVALRSRSLH